MIATYLRPSGGSIRVLSLDTVRQTQQVKERIGVVPQELALYNDLTAQENLTFFATMYSLGRREIETRAAELLHLMGLADRRHSAVKTYSGGMKRRLNLAVGLMNNPDLLLLDEPTVGVDPQSREAIFANLETLKQQGLTLLYTTHPQAQFDTKCNSFGDEFCILVLNSIALAS